MGLGASVLALLVLSGCGLTLGYEVGVRMDDKQNPPITREQELKEAFEYTINNKPSRITVTKVEVVDNTKVEGLEDLIKTFNNNKENIEISYKNEIREIVEGVEQPTHTYIIDKDNMESVHMLEITPQEVDKYNKLIKDKKYKEAKEYMEKIIGR